MSSSRAAALALAMLLSWVVHAEPQPAQQRIGLLWLEADITPQNLAALRDGLRAHGLEEGRNVRFERRDNVRDYAQLDGAAAELVELKVDAILAWGTTATRAAHKATATVPIVMLAAIDPVEAGLATSLARPGGNVTGVTTFGQELVAKRLEVLKEAVPGIGSVAILVNPGSQGKVESMRHAEAAARALKLRLRVVEIKSPEEIEAAIATVARAGAGALTAVPSTMFRANRARIAEIAAAHRLPTMFEDGGYVDAGGLLGYGMEPRHYFRLAAEHVARILKGARPAELPIERPTKLELVINMKTAKALGIKIPQAVLLRADRVIE